MSFDDLKSELLSVLESEHIGRLRELDKRLRERHILITGYRVDPLKKVVVVKIDVMRELRLDAEKQQIEEQGSAKFLESILDGIPGYVAIIDAETRIERFNCGPNVEMDTTVTIEHTYVLFNGKYLCEESDPSNPLRGPQPTPEQGERLQAFKRMLSQQDGVTKVTKVTYQL